MAIDREMDSSEVPPNVAHTAMSLPHVSLLRRNVRSNLVAFWFVQICSLFSDSVSISDARTFAVEQEMGCLVDCGRSLASIAAFLCIVLEYQLLIKKTNECLCAHFTSFDFISFLSSGRGSSWPGCSPFHVLSGYWTSHLWGLTSR